MPRRFNAFSIFSGAIIEAIGIFITTRYYLLGSLCRLNRILCPNYSVFLALGIICIAVGATLMANGLFPPRRELGIASTSIFETRAR